MTNETCCSVTVLATEKQTGWLWDNNCIGCRRTETLVMEQQFLGHFSISGCVSS